MVTGGASGIGRAIALALAEAGADAAIGSLLAIDGVTRPAREDTYLPTGDELARTRASIEAHGVKALALPLDVCSDESVQAFYDAAIEAFGKVDILANAAGTDLYQTMVGHPDALWHKVIDTNLNANYRTIKRCLPGMIERKWGRIIVIASTAASVGAAGHAAYCAAKSGLLGLMRCVALEGAPHGVSCNAISPATVETTMAETSFMHEFERGGGKKTMDELRAQVLATYPQNRFLQPSEIGALAAFLCRDEAFGISMENVTISAGALW